MQPPGATVEPIEEAAASPPVRAIFDDIKRTKNIDFVPRFWRTLATNETLLRLSGSSSRR